MSEAPKEAPEKKDIENTDNVSALFSNPNSSVRTVELVEIVEMLDQPNRYYIHYFKKTGEKVITLKSW